MKEEPKIAPTVHIFDIISLFAAEFEEPKMAPFVHIFDIIFLFAAEFEEPKIGISGKGLTTHVRKL